MRYHMYLEGHALRVCSLHHSILRVREWSSVDRRGGEGDKGYEKFDLHVDSGNDLRPAGEKSAMGALLLSCLGPQTLSRCFRTLSSQQGCLGGLAVTSLFAVRAPGNDRSRTLLVVVMLEMDTHTIIPHALQFEFSQAPISSFTSPRC